MSSPTASIASQQSDWKELLDDFETSDNLGSEAQAAPTLGSPGKQHMLPHTTSLNHGSALAGYVGKLSEASWMQRAREHLLGEAVLLEPDVHANRFDFPTLQTMDLTYFMDEDDLNSVDETAVDPFHVPPKPMALALSEAYFHAVQGGFLFIQREEFLHELTHLSIQASPYHSRRFLASANMVWAIGSRFLEASGLQPDAVPEAHLTYYARARALGLDYRIHLDHPDMYLVQGTGLLAFYLMLNGSIQR